MGRLLIFLTVIFQSSLMATTFIPISIEEQIAGSDGAAEVKLLDTKVYKNKSNQITTEYIFKFLKLVNLEKSNFSDGKLHLQLPGGSFEGVTTKIEGAPEFEKNKPIFLMLKKVENEVYLSNYTVGKFNIKKINGEEYLINEVFPMQPNVGRIKKSQMLSLMNAKWNLDSGNELPLEKSAEKKMHKIVRGNDLNTEQKIERKIASTEVEEPLSGGQIAVIVLAFVGIVFSIMLLKKGKNEGE